MQIGLLYPLTITALTVTSGVTPVVTVASDSYIKSMYNVQSTQSLINSLSRLGGDDMYDDWFYPG